MPDLCKLANCFPESFPFLLDSAAVGALGAHSILLLAGPETLVRHSDGKLEGPGQGKSFFDRLDSWYKDEKLEESVAFDQQDREIPFIGGWFLYLGYEMAAEVEQCLSLPSNQSGLPDAFATRCPGAISVFHADPSLDRPEASALITAESLEALNEIKHLIQEAHCDTPKPLPKLLLYKAEDPQKFKEGVRRVLHYLRAGDVFQVNVSRLWKARFENSPDEMSLYQSLRVSSPAPFAGLMRWGPSTLLSSSPERLVQIRGRQVQTRPIAGTRPRSADQALDLAFSEELIENAKERAEHIMLIDLERNDLGRVCIPGTVEVDELMVIESYSHVHHIVSNVRGLLTQDAGPVQTVKAVFPGGTITGCPKVRCMEIISELEQEGRGFYTGSMGYLGVNGCLDMNILIRSMLLEGKNISFRTGAGIVADSDPDHELLETEHKAKGLLKALGGLDEESISA